MAIRISKIRENITAVLGVMSMMALAIAVIGHFEKKALHANLEKIKTDLTVVASINATQQKTIDYLFNQRELDEQLLTKLDESYTTLAESNAEAKRTLEELKREDADFTAILSKRHPVDVNRLLNSIRASDSN